MLEEALVHAPRFGFALSMEHAYAACFEDGVAAATPLTRIGDGVVHLRDAGSEDGIGAGRSASEMAARLERHIEGSAVSPLSGVLERNDLGVPAGGRLCDSLAYDLAVGD